MAFPKFNFTKSWKRSSDFPTIETDETTVRDDMQLLFDECRTAIHNLIDALAGTTGASNIGTASGGNLEDTVSRYEGMEIETEISDAPTNSQIPTAKAVKDSIDQKIHDIGAGDMAADVYDTEGKREDIFAYADAGISAHLAASNPHNISKTIIGLGNVENKSVADIKTELTGSVAEGNTGFATGDAVYLQITSHNHDGRYYTETEMDEKLSEKSDTTHNHTGVYSPVGHTHDDRYYTESEIDTKLNGKAATSHTHDDRYYTESEINTKLSGKSDTTHNHEGTYLNKNGIILGSNDYGTTFPSNPQVGRLFFKKV